MNRVKRIIVLIAVIIGVIFLIRVTLSFSEKTEGPLESFFRRAGVWMDKMDDRLITKRHGKERAQSLSWLTDYAQNPDRLKHPDHYLIGAFDNNAKQTFQPVLDLEDSLQVNFSLIHIYSAWGSGSDQRFPVSQANDIYRLGSIPVLTWEPWLNDFDRDKHPHLKPVEKRDLHGLSDIVKGVYDFYLEPFVKDVKDFDKPIFIRFGHEMNDPYRYTWGPQNNSNLEFVEAWKYVVDFFRNRGANQVIWIWSPHPAYGYFKEYYPGDAYVDWIGIGTLNYGTAAVWSKWWSFDEIFGNHYAELDAFNKPIMLTEFGCLQVGGDRAAWFADAMCDLPELYPSVKSVIFFHFDNDFTLTDKSLDWSFESDSAVIDRVRYCLKNLR